MATIIGSKKQGDKIILKIEMDYEEHLQLEGNMEKIHLFSKENSKTETHMSRRSENEFTRYFSIPVCLREGLNLNGKVKCQKRN